MQKQEEKFMNYEKQHEIILKKLFELWEDIVKDYLMNNFSNFLQLVYIFINIHIWLFFYQKPNFKIFIGQLKKIYLSFIKNKFKFNKIITLNIK